MSMIRKPPSAYGGGYSDALREQINNVALPEKVKCFSCKKLRQPNAYSKRQQEIIRHAVVLQGKRAANFTCEARCRTCIGGSVVELKCSICDKTKTLEHFAKNQRGDRDTARCLNCVQSALDVEPLPGRQRQFPDTATATIAGAATSQAEVTALTESAEKLNVGENRPVPYGSIDNGANEVNAGNEDWSESRRKEETALATTKQDRQYVGYSADGRPYPVTTLDKKPVTRYEDYFNNAPGTVESTRGNAKWPRVPGRRIPKGKEPSMRVPEPVGEDIPSDENTDEEELQNFL
ncbi:uncharacterized protein BO97DRAFT_426414 [Aspergillus homomorphus CBS 101889]|uniref:Stc1 domain-containing protein n=1 Tax=Aspergillus homomorphus (strain CBS 101889) TaxID=1450537 RepID=A0A395HS95_ASPHC|nr:hypothetical protein BO97DRAFT_426414 [Aspergillus homomorphus CBS 101889]RAL10650.1 hypothetical protein BO97DRAFT_426414 [Aspergillus homomorphus CBS 101889]